MSDFFEIIGHSKKLNKALKDTQLSDIEILITKLQHIVNTRKEQEATLLALTNKKLQKIQELQKIMLDCNISLDDLIEEKPMKEIKKRAPRPAKYQIELDGSITTWTGQGRIPNIFKNAKMPLEFYSIK